MRGNMKFHAMAIGSICVIVTLLYLVMGPSKAPADDGMAHGDRYVSVFTASWGLNCNSEITRLRSQAVTINPDGSAQPRPELVTPNNVLLPVGEICNGRLRCNFPVNAAVLGVDPLLSCYKELEVSYRCFSIDRLWTKKFSQGDTLSIDCSTDTQQ